MGMTRFIVDEYFQKVMWTPGKVVVYTDCGVLTAMYLAVKSHRTLQKEISRLYCVLSSIASIPDNVIPRGTCLFIPLSVKVMQYDESLPMPRCDDRRHK